MQNKTTCRIIRAGAGFHFVLAVSPADADPYASHAKLFVYTLDATISTPLYWLNPISLKDAQPYFNGMQDAFGFADIPETDFPSPDALQQYIEGMRVGLRQRMEATRPNAEECRQFQQSTLIANPNLVLRPGNYSAQWRNGFLHVPPEMLRVSEALGNHHHRTIILLAGIK